MTVVFKSKFSEIDSEVDKCKIGLEKQYFLFSDKTSEK